MRTKIIFSFSIGFLIFTLFLQWLRLPMAQGDMWMSPDETAVATAAATFAEKGSFLFPMTLPSDFAWVHPRSWVYIPQEQRLAPVGFLGMPGLLSIFYSKFGVMGLNIFTPILALFTLFALWRVLPKRWPNAAKIATLCIWMTFPTVILYANRGLFAQLPVVCLAIWTWWGLAPMETPSKAWYDMAKFILAGVAWGLAVAIRPTELPWLVVLPIVALSLNFGRRKHDAQKANGQKVWLKALIFVLPSVVILAIGAWLGYETYGTWLVSGYQIRPQILVGAANVSLSSAPTAISILQTLPFDFHPRNIYWNVTRYFLGILWPWTLSLMVALLIGVYELWSKHKDAWRDLNKKEKIWMALRRVFDDKTVWGIVVLIWPAFWTLLFYGNGLYHDNVRLGEISLGNSFLRYILPSSVILAVAAGFIVARAWSYWQFKLLAACGAAALVSIGLWTSMDRDKEGVLANVNEVIRYHEIRTYAKKAFAPDAVILSERNDKVFFPAFLAVAPMPQDDQILSLLDSGHTVGVLLTTQDDAGVDDWLNRGFYLNPLEEFGNQTLYEIQAY